MWLSFLVAKQTNKQTEFCQTSYKNEFQSYWRPLGSIVCIFLAKKKVEIKGKYAANIRSKEKSFWLFVHVLLFFPVAWETRIFFMLVKILSWHFQVIICQI